MIRLIALLAAVCLHLAAATSYTQAVTSVTSVTITGATHALTCSSSIRIAVRVYDSSGNVYSGHSVSQNNATCDVTITWQNSFTGSVNLRGGFATTNNSDDWAVFTSDGEEGGPAKAYICNGCTTVNYVYRPGKGVLLRKIEWSGPAAAVTVRVYIQNKKVVFATNTGDAGSCAAHLGNDCVSETNVTSFPGDAVQLFQGTLARLGNSEWTWTTAQDLR